MQDLEEKTAYICHLHYCYNSQSNIIVYNAC